MTERLPGKYKTDLHTRPWFFSGKVPEIKYSYTEAGLTPSRYPIRARSIVPGKKLDLQPVSSGFLNVDEKKEEIGKREFREYNFLRENDVLLTIEHCDNCEDHANSTRHDPLKYHLYAQSIKNAVLSRYPMVKVLIKPISKLDPESIKKRMGAFEVQVSSKFNKNLKVEVIHSKLVSRKWPDVSALVSKLASYLPTCQLSVTVFDESAQDRYLKGLKVLLRPKPVDLEVQRPNSNYSSFRPRSAGTTRSVKTIRVMSSRRTSFKNINKNKSNVVYERVTDRDGTCTFDNIPLDMYEIEVIETKEFKGSLKVFNTFEEKLQGSSLNVYIGVKSRENCNITVILRDNLIKDEVSGAKVVISRDAELFYLAEVRKGVYEISVPKGEYQINVASSKYKEISKTISALDIETVLSENLELKKTKEFSVFTIDAITGESISGVIIELSINNHTGFEGLTKNGSFTFKIEETGLFSIKSQIRGYSKSKILTVIGNNEISSIFVPMVPLSVDFPVILISWTKCSDDLEIQAISDKPLNIKNPEIEGVALFDRLKSHGFASILVSDSSKTIRLTLKGLTKELRSLNGFLHSGINVTFYAWRKQIACIRPCSGTGEIWDVGAYMGNRKDFIETNIVNNHLLDNPSIIQEFLKIIRIVQDCDSVSNAFNFNMAVSKTMNYGKDLFLSPEILKKTLVSVVSEDFFNVFLQIVNSTDGISLSNLVNRYERYVGMAKNPIKKLQNFMDAIGIEENDSKMYKNIAEEGLTLPLPLNWEVIYDEEGNILYQNAQHETFKEFPNVLIYRKKYLEAKKQDIKLKNQNFVVNNSKELEKSSRKVSGIEKEEEKIEKKEKFEGDEEFEQSIEINQEDIEEINHQCEKLAELSVKNIEFYNTNGQIDEEIHAQLSEKIEEYLYNFEKYLKQDLEESIKDFFEFWTEKFKEIRAALREILKNIQAEKMSNSSKGKKSLNNSRNRSKKTSNASFDD